MTDRHHALDLVRGIAAAGVAVYHFLAWNEIARIQSMGTFSVYLFFVLSALTMMMVYGDRFNGSIDIDEVQSFYRNRVARLIPLLAAVAILSTIAAGVSANSVIKAALTASGLFGLHMPGFLSASIGAWSLGIEGLFYIIFPMAALIAGASSLRALIIAAAVLLIGQQALLYLLQAIDGDAFFYYYTTPLIFSPFFAIGFVIHKAGGQRSKIMLLTTVTLLLGVMVFSLLTDAPLFRSQLVYLLLTTMVALTVLCAYRSEVPAKLIGTAAFLGNISYSLYLTHWIAERIVRFIAKQLDLPLLAQFIIYAVAATILAFAVYQWFEKPARKLLRGRRRRPRQTTEVPSLP